MEYPTFLKCDVLIDNCPEKKSACFFLSHHDHSGNPICDIAIFDSRNKHGYMFLGRQITRIYETDMTDCRGACEFRYVSCRASGSLFKIIWNSEQNTIMEKQEITMID